MNYAGIMRGFWEPMAWMAAMGFVCGIVPLCRERIWQTKRGMLIFAGYLLIGYLGFAAALGDWGWPKTLTVAVAGLIGLHLDACVYGGIGFVAGICWLEHRQPRRQCVYKCPTCGDDLWFERNQNNWLVLHSTADKKASTTEESV